MRKSQRKKVARYVRNNHYRKVWHKAVRAMACVVAFCTTYALILPAITMENTYFCGMEAHEHTQQCYVQECRTQLVCQLPEQSAHIHDDNCYEAPEVLCTLPETAPHTHGEACFVTLREQSCTLEEDPGHTHNEECFGENGEQTCVLEESPGHSHTDACFTEISSQSCTLEETPGHTHGEDCLSENNSPICGLDVSDGHSHGDACFVEETQDVLICTQEVHIHTDACRSNPEADLETAADWEATMEHVMLTNDWAVDLVSIASTQVGYRESDRNYLAGDGGVRMGYTRYGAWYGIPYGQWDAMFASFCLCHAEIPKEATGWESDAENWLKAMEENPLTANALNKVPETGDLVFYQKDTASPIQVAIVLSRESTEDGLFLQLIEGNQEDQVLQHKIKLEDVTLAGCCGLRQVQQEWDNIHKNPGNDAESTKPVETEAAEAASEPAETEETEVTTEPAETEATEAASEPAETEETEVTTEPAETEAASEPVETEVTEAATEPVETEETEAATEPAETEAASEPVETEVTEAATEPVETEETEAATEPAETEATDAATEPAETEVTEAVTEPAETEATEAATEPVETEAATEPVEFEEIIAIKQEAMDATASGTVIGFQFVTADPNQLKENTDYIIYIGNGTQYNFMSATLSSVQVTGSDNYSPYQVGRSWSLSADTMGTTQVGNMAWRVVKSGSDFYLRSQSYGTYLKLNNGWSSLENQNNATRLRISYVNGASTRVGDGTYHIRYEDNTWKSTWTDNRGYWTQPTPVYFAEVTPIYAGAPNYPDAVYTGDVHVDRLRFYNICESPETGVSALAGCVFQVEGTTSSGQQYSTTIVSDNSPQIALPGNIPDGVYTITEVSAPEGYMRDLNHTREFWIQDGVLQSEHNIGTFLNHSLEQLQFGKTGEVEDYNNRIYQILLNARSNLRMFSMDPIEVLFVVDKSNSMLFPSGMVDTNKSITLRLDDPDDPNDDHSDLNNVWNNRTVLSSLNKDELHYIIADPEGTSTVYALWHDGTAWMYQDASYYVKAKFDNGDGYESDGETVIFPSNKSYIKQADEEDVNNVNYRSNGGGLDYSSRGSTLGNYINSQGGSCTFRLYTAQDQYNRLHYLEEALANMIYELADANPLNRVVLIPFTKEVQEEIYYPLDSGNKVTQPVVLTTSNTEMLRDIVTHIDTLGGTRQDLALQYAYNEYLATADSFDYDHTYTILITDGAPVRSGSSAPPLGGVNSAPNTAEDGDIYGRIKGWGAKVKEESTLMTVALGMEQVEGGKEVLEAIASNDNFHCALEDASELMESMRRILFDGMKDRGELTINNGLIVDEIADAFYPIAWTDSEGAGLTGREQLLQSGDRTWLLLQEGDWITLDGKFTTTDAGDAAGQLLRRDDGTYYIQWQNQTVSGSGWKGTFYVKAKEDFIGGNAIDTNKKAGVTVNDATKWAQTPTVNVRLLDMNQSSSEVTLYLGDLVSSPDSSPGDVLKEFYSRIGFTKIPDESQIDHLEMINRLDPDSSSADGLEQNFFFLKYALGYRDTDGNWVPRILTNDEWTTLKSGGSLTFPYVYDESSSHGDVGYFTIRLNKTSDTYDSHEAAEACQPGGQPLTENCEHPAETYTLTVTYTAYELGEQGRPQANVNNGTGGPGTEVTAAATGLNNGQGIITSTNIHEVHVISGKIVVEKVFAGDTQWTAGDSFSFQLTGQDGTVETKTVTIGDDGTATAVFDGLPRGAYTVTEAMHEEYAVKAITVAGSTNCYHTQPDPMQISFTMGNNPNNEDVIGKVEESDAFTSYIDPGKGVYGEAVFANAPRVYTGDIPVEKIWDDGADLHSQDSVYLVLYLDDQPALDTEGNARLLKVDASTGWKGAFTVVLADKNDSLANYNYSVREVSFTSETALNGWHPALLENDGETLLYYDKALPHGGVLGINGRGYIVEYSTTEAGTQVVTNLKGYSLPQTGGMGTQMYTFSGFATVLAALVYGYCLRRKRERGARE